MTGGEFVEGAGGAPIAENRVAADAMRGPEESATLPGPLKFSFVMPVYSSTKTGYFEVSTALRSILNQTDPSWEIIMVCDGPDEIMREVWRGAKGETRNRITYTELPHRGIRGGHHMIDYAVDKARGEMVCVLNGDNWIEPDYIAEMYAEADISTCWVMMHDTPGIIFTGDQFSRGRVDRLNYAIRRSVAARVQHLMHVDADYDWLVMCYDYAMQHFGGVRLNHVQKVLGHHQ